MNPRYLLIAVFAAAGCGGFAVPDPVLTNNGIDPDSIIIGPNQTTQFVLMKNGIGQTGVQWTCTGGSITSSGKYTSPSMSGDYTVTASKNNTVSNAHVTVN